MANEVARLGAAIAERRRQLGLSQIEVWQRGGPSNSTLTRIENGLGDPPSIATMRKLDRALDWQPGSAARVLTGGSATSSPDDDCEARSSEPPEPERDRAEQHYDRIASLAGRSRESDQRAPWVPNDSLVELIVATTIGMESGVDGRRQMQIMTDATNRAIDHGRRVLLDGGDDALANAIATLTTIQTSVKFLNRMIGELPADLPRVDLLTPQSARSSVEVVSDMPDTVAASDRGPDAKLQPNTDGEESQDPGTDDPA